MYSPLAMFAFTGATIPPKWEYTIYQLPAGLWSADTACSEEKGNPVILCLKLDSHRGTSCPSRHYLIGRRTSYISGSMTSFILPSHLPSGEYFLLFSPFLIIISALLFLVILHENCFSECKATAAAGKGSEMSAGGFGICGEEAVSDGEDPHTKLGVIILWSE